LKLSATFLILKTLIGVGLRVRVIYGTVMQSNANSKLEFKRQFTIWNNKVLGILEDILSVSAPIY
jgi:hypothetical protein